MFFSDKLKNVQFFYKQILILKSGDRAGLDNKSTLFSFIHALSLQAEWEGAISC